MKKKLIATLLLVTLTMTTALTGCGSSDKEIVGDNISSGGESNDNTVANNDVNSNAENDVQDGVFSNQLEELVLDVAGTEIVIAEGTTTESFVEILGSYDENNDEDDFYYNTSACRISIKDDNIYLGELSVHVRQWDGYSIETSDVIFAGIKLGDSLDLVKEKFGTPSRDAYNQLTYVDIPVCEGITFTTLNVEYDENEIITDITAFISFGEEN